MSHYYGNCPKCKETECIDVDTDTCSECGYQKGDEKYEAGYRAGLEAAAKALPKLNRYEVGGECDGDSGHCYAEMELDDAGRYIGLDDAEAAIRALAKEGR